MTEIFLIGGPATLPANIAEYLIRAGHAHPVPPPVTLEVHAARLGTHASNPGGNHGQSR